MNLLSSYFQSGELFLFDLFNHRIHCRILNPIMGCITHLGSLSFSVLFSLSFVLIPSLRPLGVEMIFTLLISGVAVQILKRATHRKRPFEALSRVFASHLPSCPYSFPSGHTTAAFSMALVLARGFPVAAFLALGLGMGVGISRIYLGVHYPSDVLAGFSIAFMSSLILQATLF